jgi:hypothetical protein
MWKSIAIVAAVDGAFSLAATRTRGLRASKVFLAHKERKESKVLRARLGHKDRREKQGHRVRKG